VIVALLVVSHWVLDWLVHRPDLPLYPGGPKVGLGLWNHPFAEIPISDEPMIVAAMTIAIRRRWGPARGCP